MPVKKSPPTTPRAGSPDRRNAAPGAGADPAGRTNPSAPPSTARGQTPDKTPDNSDRPGPFSLLGTASAMGLHMVTGPAVGAGLGWLADRWLDSWPAGAAIGLLLGVAAGFRNVWADARYLIRAQEPGPQSGPQSGPGAASRPSRDSRAGDPSATRDENRRPAP